jgi:hypothetical protein
MSGLMSGIRKFFTKERIMIFVVLGVLIFFLSWYSGNKYSFADGMDNLPASSAPIAPVLTPPNAGVTGDKPKAASAAVQPVAQGGYTAQSTVNPTDLLPVDQNSQWASLNPVNQGNPITPDLLQAGYHIGLDTIGQTLKNPNLQLRSDPYIPKAAVGPWNQSTYEPDLMRVPLEVGVGPQ